MIFRQNSPFYRKLQFFIFKAFYGLYEAYIHVTLGKLLYLTAPTKYLLGNTWARSPGKLTHEIHRPRPCLPLLFTPQQTLPWPQPCPPECPMLLLEGKSGHTCVPPTPTSPLQWLLSPSSQCIFFTASPRCDLHMRVCD